MDVKTKAKEDKSGGWVVYRRKLERLLSQTLNETMSVFQSLRLVPLASLGKKDWIVVSALPA